MNGFEEVHNFLTSWYGIVLAAIVAYNVFDYVRVKVVMKKLNCVGPTVELDGFFGFRVIFTLLKHKREGTLVDFRKDMELDTLRFRVAGTPMVITRNPENIKAILATQFNK